MITQDPSIGMKCCPSSWLVTFSWSASAVPYFTTTGHMGVALCCLVFDPLFTWPAVGGCG